MRSLTLLIGAMLAMLSTDGHAADLFLNPFNKDSAHHRPIGTGAIYAGDSDPTTIDWMKSSLIWVNVGPSWGFSVVQSRSSDPLVTINYDGRYGRRGLPARLRVPMGFNGGTTSDANAGIYDPAAQMLHELYRFHQSGGRYTASLNYVVDVRGKGHLEPGQRGQLGISASGQSELLTTLRGFEINTPGVPIQHALNLCMPGDQMLANGLVWPASSTDWFASQNGGHIPYGALLAIPTQTKGGPNLDTLGLSEPGKRVAQALRDYGAYVYDNSGGVTMRADQMVTRAVVLQVVADLGKVYRYIRVVKNNVPGTVASGGGDPIAVHSAFDAKPLPARG